MKGEQDFWKSLSGNLWFIVGAYTAALFGWAAISTICFMDASRKTVAQTRDDGNALIFFTFFPFLYILFYTFVMGKTRDYTEMCTAIVASLFALRYVLPTVWGLWQLRLFRKWSINSIQSLRLLGINCRLKNSETDSSDEEQEMGVEDMADEMLVTEKITDNEFRRGDVLRYGAYEELQLLQGKWNAMREEFPFLLKVVETFAGFVTWPIGRLFSRNKFSSLRRVPDKPLDIWVHWAPTFIAQISADWVDECDTSAQPAGAEGGNEGDGEQRAMERLRARGRESATEAVASSASAVVPEYLSSSHNRSVVNAVLGGAGPHGRRSNDRNEDVREST